MPRPAGLPNKNKRSLRATLRREHGADWNPILRAAKQADNLDSIANDYYKEYKDAQADRRAEGITSLEEELFCRGRAMIACEKSVVAWLKIGKYVEPELKPMDIDASVKQDLTVVRKDYGSMLTIEERKKNEQ